MEIKVTKFKWIRNGHKKKKNSESIISTVVVAAMKKNYNGVIWVSV